MHPIGRHVEVKKTRIESCMKVDVAAKVIAAFNTWGFKREQPSDMPLLTALVQKKVSAGRPIEFVLYWGKGPRNHPAAPEYACLDFLAAMARRIAEVHAPGANVRLICTDTHAALNGHSQAAAMSYFCAVGEAAKGRGFRWCLLGDLTRRHADNFAHACPAMRQVRTIEQLERSAARWYKGTGQPVDGAMAYYDMNMVEKQAVELEFPDAIFITFSGSELRELFPDRMPLFYMYSVRKGVSVKPWFIEDAVAPAVTPT
jgi:L-tyrosine isonitrile synthase